jgi:HK97 family phage portal protein
VNIFGLTIERTKAAVGLTTVAPSNWSGGVGRWFGTVLEPFAGAWQRNISYSQQDVLTQSTVWACITLIMSDIGKITPNLVELKEGIWEPTENSAYSPVLRKPNHYQNRIKFFEHWICSKLTRGNTYVLKERDNRGGENRGNVIAHYILDPTRVQVLVAPNGEVFYQLSSDNLAGLPQDVTVPASEIIHDVGVAMYHPLCGLSPLVACALAASQSLSIQNSSARFFANNSKPGGVLTAPNKISQEAADRIKAHWEANFSGEENAGKVAVLGDGLKYEPMAVSAVESDLAKQLAWTDEKICAVFHVPPFMVGVGPMPTYDNIEKLNLQYYQQCLQNLIECIELCLDEGLGLSATLGVEFDLDGLVRMDSATKMKNVTEGVLGAIYTPNEGRKKFNLRPKDGGDSPMLQQQNYSLEALAKRDASADPFGTAEAAPPKPTPSDDPEEDDVKGLFIKAAEMQAGQWYRSCPQL